MYITTWRNQNWKHYMLYNFNYRKIFIFYFLMIFIFSIIVGLHYSINFLLYSKMTQSLSLSLSLSLTHTHPHTYTSFYYIFFHRVSSQATRYSSLCYTAGSHWLSTPNAIFSSINSKLSIHSTSSASPLTTGLLFSKNRTLFKMQNFGDIKNISECKG